VTTEEVANEEPHWLPIDITFDDSQQDGAQTGPVTFEPTMVPSDPFGLSFGLGFLGGLTGGAGMGFNALKDPYGMPSVSQKTHLGIASCNLLKDYTSTYPCLREVGILLKEFLSIHDLNSAYRGKSERYFIGKRFFEQAASARIAPFCSSWPT